MARAASVPSVIQQLSQASDQSAIESIGLDDAGTLIALSKSTVCVHILDQVQY